MREKRNNLVYLIAMSMIIFFGISAFADNFSNNLLETNITKSSVDGININLSTSKPYKDSVIVNKKSNNEYVILMPETSNSTVSAPSLKGVSDIVTSVNVKTQQYQGSNIKGYTKITIHTTKPVNINPKVTVANVQHKLTNNDYNQLMASAKKVQTTPKTNVNKVTSTNAKSSTTNVVSNNTQIIKGKSKTTLPSANQKLEKKPLTANKSVQVQKTVNKVESNKVTKPVKVVEKDTQHTLPQNMQVENENPQAPVAQQIVDNVTTEPETVDNTVQEDNSINNENEPVQEQDVVSQKDDISSQILAPLLSVWHILKRHLPIVLIALIFTFASMLLIARNMVSSIRKAKDALHSNLNEVEKAAVDYNEKINEDMTWKEKYQTYVDAKEENENDTSVSQSGLNLQNSNLDDLFMTNEDIEEKNVPQTQEELNFDNVSDMSIIQEENLVENDVESLQQDAQISQDDSFESQKEVVVNESPELALNSQAQENIPSTINEDEFISGEDFDASLNAEDLFYEPEEPSRLDVARQEYSTRSENKNGDINFDIVEEPEVIENIAPEVSSGVMQTVSAMQNDLQDENLISNTPQEVSDSSDDDIVKSEFVIDENKGLYLINYEDASALVGRIDDDVFMLKKFDDVVTSPLKARVNETDKNATRYMTRVGKFRGVVEVTSNNMNLLVEL